MKKRIMKILVLTIGISLVFGYAIAQTKTDTKPAKDASVSSSAVTKMPAPIEKPKFYYNSKGKPDPMNVPWMKPSRSRTGGPGPVAKPVVVRIKVEEHLKGQVSGIVYCETNPSGSLALVGSKIVKIGDSVKIGKLPKTVKIVKITKQDVLMSYEGKTYPVKISGS